MLVIFALLDPDLAGQNQCGSMRSLRPMRGGGTHAVTSLFRRWQLENEEMKAFC
jgi:hypothetical protein